MIKLLELPIKELYKNKIYVSVYRHRRVRHENSIKVTGLHNSLRVFLFIDGKWKANIPVNGNRYMFNDSQLFHLFNHGEYYGHKDYSVYEVVNTGEVFDLRLSLESMSELVS